MRAMVVLTVEPSESNDADLVPSARRPVPELGLKNEGGLQPVELAGKLGPLRGREHHQAAIAQRLGPCHVRGLEARDHLLAGGVLAVFKNHPADRFATRIPITGNLKDPKLSSWEALVAILRNTLVEAFQPQLENARD